MKLKYLIYVAIFSGSLVACDVTDLSPIDSFTDESYWTSVNDLKLYANGLYGNLSAPTATGDNISDNFVTNSYSSYLFNELTIPAEASSDNGWYWNTIRNCNYFMQRYDKVPGPEEEINKYVAEVRFFRGLLYFDKIKSFGDVPWYETDLQTSDTEELYKARDNRDYVLGKIMADIGYAINWLPTKANAESGRLHKDAAKTQLARICLYYGTYKKYHNETSSVDSLSSTSLLQKAASLAKEIMDSGNYSIVKGTDAGSDQLSFDGYPLYYSNQFTQEDLSTNAEGILCRFYETGVLTHETGRQVSENGMGLSKDFVESFLMKDGTPIFNAGSGYKGDDNQENEFADRDPRIYQIIDNKHRPYTVISGTRYVNAVANVTASQGVTGYPCVKYRSANSKQAEARNTSYDWFVYRYAEVLLIYAEAQAELGLCTQEVLDKTINLLRDRVEMAHLTVSPVADVRPIDYGYTLSNLLYEIRRERRIELIAEGFRLDDLKRWNAMKLLENPKTMFGLRITDDVIAAYAAANITFGGASGRPIITYDGETYLYQYAAAKTLNDAGRVWSDSDRRWLSPVPTNEITLNPNLIQNPGWN
ncbi:SusD family [Proteiniphilum saccharofermentans]|uniref:SusD family n=1 Tax=Proteiniphilum saccharofermentans TaxID=1642647 RepID=A0A1R3T363_9BACT|nr:RagB/SusD family nutrient uptake outer membrane protein [Proteiniphilum saccharofermentans]SCD22151.1 SusD family [Proteiniphilum saccharofermentans]